MTSRSERRKEEVRLKTPHEHADLVFKWVTDEFYRTLDSPTLLPIHRIHSLFSILANLRADEQKLSHFHIYKDIKETYDRLYTQLSNLLDEYLESLIETKAKARRE